MADDNNSTDNNQIKSKNSNQNKSNQDKSTGKKDESPEMQKLNSALDTSKMADAAADAMNNAVEQINSTISSLVQPIQDAVDSFKKIPPKLRSVVDIQGAAQGLYSKLDDFQKSVQSLAANTLISTEVPITPEDYHNDPAAYPNLQAIQYQKNSISQEDCDKAGYTKLSVTINQEWLENIIEQLGLPPEDRDIVADTAENMLNSTIKPLWDAVSTPIKTVASMVSLGPLSDIPTAVTDSIDGLVKLASTKVDEKALDQKLAASSVGAAEQQNVLDKIKGTADFAKQSTTDKLNELQKQASLALDTAQAGADKLLTAGQNAFQNLKAPPLPSDIIETLDDFYDAVICVKNNLSNIYTILILKMIGQILDAFNEIIGVIGVPSIPSPLGQIPQIITDAQTVFEFVSTLPMSLGKLAKALLKKKMKILQVATTPTPPSPPKQVVPKGPACCTKENVPEPTITWDVCIEKLKEMYYFSANDAADIVKGIQEFYTGDEPAQVLVDTDDEHDVEIGDDTYTNETPVVQTVNRDMIGPIEFFKTKMDIMVIKSSFRNEYFINFPSSSKKPTPKQFWAWTDRGGKPVQEYIDITDTVKFGDITYRAKIPN